MIFRIFSQYPAVPGLERTPLAYLGQSYKTELMMSYLIEEGFILNEAIYKAFSNIHVKI